jgi:hypothetical protein
MTGEPMADNFFAIGSPIRRELAARQHCLKSQDLIQAKAARLETSMLKYILENHIAPV